MPSVRRETWKHFTEKSTLHGLRYVFIGKSFSMRRLIWGILLLAAIATFGVQVFYTVTEYLSYKTTVTTRQETAEELTFPAVTICNLNQFRATAAVEYGLFDMIEEALQGRNVSGKNKYDGKDINVTNFFLQAAHQKQDLVRSCKWRGQACSVERDFDTVVTEGGVCYTFNGGKKRAELVTRDSGAGSGLQLMINIEQYDYIPGPHNDAGIKVILHEPNSPAAVSSVQFLVGPGNHAMASLKMRQMLELSWPYGNCDSGSSSTYSQCLASCWAKRLMNLCGCQDPFIASLVTGSRPRCSVTSALGCVQPHMGSVRRKPLCDCPKPCKSTDYDPILSYSQLLKLNAEKMAIENDNKMGHLRQSFLNARAVSEKHIPGIAQRDRKFVSRSVDAFTGYYDNLFQTTRDIQNEARLWNSRSVIHLYDRLISAVDNDLELIKNEYDKQKAKADSVKLSYATALGVHLHHMKQFFGKSMTESELLAKSLMCNNTNNAQILPNYATDCSKGNRFWQEKDQQAKVLSMSGYHHDMFIAASVKQYTQVVTDLFRNMSRSLEDVNDHKMCLSSFKRMNVSFWESIKLSKDYVKSATFAGKAVVVHRAFNATNIVSEFNTSLTTAQKSCAWYERGWDKFKSLLDTKINALGDDQVAMRKSYDEIIAKLENMKMAYLKDVIPVQQSLQSFLKLNGSKMHLADMFEDLDTKRALSDLQQAAFKILSHMRQFDEKMSNYQRHIRQTLSYVFNFSIPVVEPNVLRTTEINQIGIDLRSKSIIEQEYTGNNPDALSSVIVKALGQFREFLGSALRQQFNLSNQCLRSVAELEALLKEYVQHNTMNERFYRENFLQLDVFFQDLSYEIKQQEVATRLTAVFGSIGSYTAFCLGASILTLIEFFDFIIIKLLGFCMDVDEEPEEATQHAVPMPPPPPGPKGKVHIYHVPDSPEDIYSVVPDGTNYRGTPHKSPAHLTMSPQRHAGSAFASPNTGYPRVQQGFPNEPLRHQVVRAPQPHVPQSFDRDFGVPQHQQVHSRDFSAHETFKPQATHLPHQQQRQQHQQISHPVRI